MLQAQKTVLVVDDAPANLAVIHSILRGSYRVLVASSAAKALELARGPNPPDLVLLDVMMPLMDGYEVCRILKSDPSTHSIPVLFLSGKTSLDDEARGFECGGADYIHKPINPPVLRARVRTHLRLGAGGEAFYAGVLDSIGDQIAVLDESGVIVAVNRAWRDFAENNGAPLLAARSVGLSYLGICEAALPEAAEVLEGMQAVLAGTQDEFQLEYPCHSPDLQRWFQMHVSRLRGGGVGAVVTHKNLTAQRLTNESLSQSGTRYRQLFIANPNPMYVYDRETLVFLDVNQAALDHYGYSREEFLALKASNIRPSEELPDFCPVWRHPNMGSGQPAFGGIRKRTELPSSWI